MKLEELQRLAEGARADGDWFPPDFGHGYIGRADAAFMSAMSPDTAKKLIAAAFAGENAAESLQEVIELLDMVLGVGGCYPPGANGPAVTARRRLTELRAALEELK